MLTTTCVAREREIERRRKVKVEVGSHYVMVSESLFDFEYEKLRTLQAQTNQCWAPKCQHSKTSRSMQIPCYKFFQFHCDGIDATAAMTS